MTNDLQTKLDSILADKNTNLKPENLKSGVTLLGINGTLEQENILSKEEYHVCSDIALQILGKPTSSLYSVFSASSITEEDEKNTGTAYGCTRIDFSDKALAQTNILDSKTLKEVLEEYPYVTLFYEYMSSWSGDKPVYFSKAPLTISAFQDGTRVDIQREQDNTTYCGEGWQYLADVQNYRDDDTMKEYTTEQNNIADILPNQISTPLTQYSMLSSTISLPSTGTYKDKLMIFANYELTVNIEE